MLREAFLERPPPSFKGKRLVLRYATQAASETPTIVLFVNDVHLLHFGYRRYLENRLRERFGFAGNPLRLVLRASHEAREARGS
jgi:GTP-binding protein